MRWGWLAAVAVVSWAGLLVPGLRAEDSTPAWKAGSAFVRITPDRPMWMAGYAARTKPSEGTALDLFAKALTVEDSTGNRAAIITLDLISVPRVLRDRVAGRVADRYGIPADAMLINCSHTHCGPELRTSEVALSDVEAERAQQALEYSTWLERQLVELVGAALEGAVPSQLSYYRSRAGFAMNRRLPTGDGFRNSPNPEGPVDHDVPVLAVSDMDGKLHTLLFGYACHNTTLGFYEFCGDYAGFAQRSLETAHPGVTAMFVEGCGGDQNPYPRGNLDLARIHGQTLATAVEAALQTPQIPLQGPLQAGLKLAEVEYAPAPSEAELRGRLETGNKYVVRHAERLLDQLAKEGSLRTSYACPVQVLKFGEGLTLIALPGETVVDYSLRLKRELAGQNVWVAGYSNDVFAYVPSRRVLEEGGYEGGGALIYFTSVLHPGPFAPSVEERVVGAVYDVLRAMGGTASE